MGSLQPRDVCGSPSNNDLYGLGIRLGFYFQMIAFVIANKRSAAKGTRGTLIDSINVTLLATFIAIVRDTVDGTVRAVDLYIVDNLVFSQVATALFSPDQFLEHPFNSLVMALLAFAIKIFYAWFWFNGIKTLPRSTCPDDYGFLFAKVNLYGWFTTFWKVISVFEAIVAGMTLIAVPATWLVEGKEQADNATGNAAEVRYKTGKKKLRSLVFIVFPICLITTECTIQFNHLENVYSMNSVGQLIPLILGIGLVVYMLFGTTTFDESLARINRFNEEQRIQRFGA